MDKVLFSQVPLDELMKSLRSVVREEIEAFNKASNDDKLISSSEVCQLFQPSISRVTLNSWTNLGYMKQYRIGGRVYYKYSEVLQSAKTLKKYKRPPNNAVAEQQ